MKWHKSYETGNELVDNDHKELFEMVNGLIESSFEKQNSKAVETIDYLSDYVLRHFANEERLMEESNYPDTAVHKQQHMDFVEVVADFRIRLSIDSSDDLMLQANKTIVEWLSSHVLGSDKALAVHYRESKGIQED